MRPALALTIFYLLLFAALAAVMQVTRRTDWYRVGSRSAYSSPLSKCSDESSRE